jgi:hypothetical protein
MSRRDRTGWAARFFLALPLAIIWTPASLARTTPVDDSGTQALEPSVSLRWKTVAPAHGAAGILVGRTTLRVRLNVLPWLHRAGRIYLVLPAQAPGPVAATWVTQGRLAPGQLRSGDRALVYAGPLTAPFLEDVVNFEFSVDARLVDRPFPVNFRFEIDED